MAAVPPKRPVSIINQKSLALWISTWFEVKKNNIAAPKTLKIKVYNWILAVECPSGIYFKIITDKAHASAVKIGKI